MLSCMYIDRQIDDSHPNPPPEVYHTGEPYKEGETAVCGFLMITGCH